MMISKVTRSLVACNVYISAGGHPKHKELLLELLGETQERCRLANRKEDNSLPTSLSKRVVLVHAFRDGPYDRSSFHLAGSPDLVAEVGSSLAVSAVKALMHFETTNTLDNDSERTCYSKDSPTQEVDEKESIGRRHPTVGLVDHVSVLPLDENHSCNSNNDRNEPNEIGSISGSVARDIGENLRSSGVHVLYYGHAHPLRKELAAVRRDSTRFFQDNKMGGARDDDSADSKNGIPNVAGQATVGAPDRFVENYNIRLKPNVSRSVARTLTESVRERSSRGLPFVEALTLAYGRNQYEVACNLLDPSSTSASDVEERMRRWEQEQQNGDGDAGLVETAYRVGTTTKTCLNALRKVSTEEGELFHNKEVIQKLEKNFLEEDLLK